MFIPVHNEVFTLTCDKSKFIACLFLVESISEVKACLLACKNMYPKARHYLYAYKIKNLSKSNDDGEPGAIAKGFIKLLEERELDETLIVVVRYFGGIKLGASRLLRTYLNAVNEVIKQTKTKEISHVYVYQIETDYATFNKLKNAGYQLENICYNDTIKMTIIAKQPLDNVLKTYHVKNFTMKETNRTI